jgi:hypothetical protein
MSSMRQEEEMGKTHFEIFGTTGYDLSTSNPKSSNSNILVSAHPIGKIKIVPERLRSREDMVKNPFLYFECFTFRNPYDSFTSPDPGEIFEAWVFIFLPQYSNFSRIPIHVTYWLLNL